MSAANCTARGPGAWSQDRRDIGAVRLRLTAPYAGSFTPILTLLAWLALLAAPAGATGYALEAPERAHIRQAIEVGWRAPDGTGERIEIRPAAGGRAATYAYVGANPQAVEAPEAPGNYTIVLVRENDVRASRSACCRRLSRPAC